MMAFQYSTALFGTAGLAALVFGFSAYSSFSSNKSKRALRSIAKNMLDIDRRLEVSFSTRGLASYFLEQLVKRSSLSSKESASLQDLNKIDNLLSRNFEHLRLKSGLYGHAKCCTYIKLRKLQALIAALMGLALGSFFSFEMAGLCLILGLCFGCCAMPWAMKKEVEARKVDLENSLSEFIDILCLGLRSGMSFDSAFCLYCEHFSGALSESCRKAYARWTAGLETRNESLQSMSDSYDSEILKRSVKTINRSLRFGSSIVENLESLASDVREENKSNIEEKVAKAPVKMLIPVGTLILPAMLIFVLGPVMIDLMKGF